MSKETSNCVFCKIARGEIDSEIIDESDNFIVFKDAHPAAEGHSLVVPKGHYVTVLDIPNKLGSEMLDMIKKTGSAILDKKLGDGFNIVMNNLECAGQIVMHAHVHVIPRKEGDGMNLLVKDGSGEN